MDLDRARQRLEEERERLLGLRDGLTNPDAASGDAADTGELSDYDQHPGDSGTDTFQQERNLSILEHVDAQLADVDTALARVENGSYGRSVLSGEPIPDERLEALPATRYTVEEQAQIEREAGHRGARA